MTGGAPYALVTTTIRLRLTAVRWPFDCLSRVINVTPVSRSHESWWHIYLLRSQCSSLHNV